MEMKESKKGDVLILALSGELMGGEESQDLGKRVYSAIEEGLVNIVVDMSEVKWMNSSGLGLIMAGLTTLRASGGDLRLCQVSDRVHRPIEVTKLDQVIRIFGTQEDAIQSYAAGG